MTPERNKAAALEEFEVWSSGEVGRLDDLVAPDVVHHDPYDPHAAAGLAGLKESIAANRRRFPDFAIRVETRLRSAIGWPRAGAPE